MKNVIDMKLKGIKPLKSELDVITFLAKNKIPFEYRDNGDIVVSRIESYRLADQRARFVSEFIEYNFQAVGRNAETNDLLFCNLGFTELFAKNEFTPVQIWLTR